ncbi:hypothetical protein C6502_19975 [Candidatus Poribacteria bacterium]|nr:MAG: hypothetical protein C6502_19975 [Candidatus Poribacteria bacterium]
MQPRYNLAYFVRASVVFLGLTSLMVDADAQAQIAFESNRTGNWEIYMMDADGGNPQNLTNNPFAHDRQPAWYSPAFAVAPADKQFTMWGWLKQVAR